MTEPIKQTEGRNPFSRFLANNLVFLPFLGLLLLFMAVWPEKITEYPRFVDWQTVLNLTGLLLVVTAIKESAFVGRFSRRLLVKTKTERGLAFSLVLLSGVLSMFLTNDIALFITIPLTLGFRDVIRNDLKKLIIFQALAVNVGSALTPIGNPQNLFLWHQWDISFFRFTAKMLPLFAVLAVVMAVLVWVSFSAARLSFHTRPRKNNVNTKLFVFSLVLLVAFVASLELGRTWPALAGVTVFYLLFYRKVFLKTDWMLLLLFAVMFVDFHLLSEVPFVIRFITHFDMAHAAGTYMGAAWFSQVMSNVPATIFVSKFSTQWLALAYGANVGGNGLVVASLANIIALRLASDRKIWLAFHRYSVIYFLVSGALVWLLFFR